MLSIERVPMAWWFENYNRLLKFTLDHFSIFLSSRNQSNGQGIKYALTQSIYIDILESAFHDVLQ